MREDFFIFKDMTDMSSLKADGKERAEKLKLTDQLESGAGCERPRVCILEFLVPPCRPTLFLIAVSLFT